MSDFLPFEHEARALGYSIYAHSTNRQSATYLKDGIGLDVHYDSQGRMVGKLSFIWRLLTISTGEFSLPHPNLSLFEKQVVSAQIRLAELDAIEGRATE